MNAEKLHQLIQKKRFPDTPRTVELIETHISWVLITESYAYKIKKPLAFSFLDFSSLEKRKYFCQQEYELNSRLAPNMYLGVLPIVEKEGELIVGGTGTIIDYAVHMKRMDYSRQMDVLLKKNEVEEEHMLKIADQLARFHQRTKKIRQFENVSQIHLKFADLASIAGFMEKHFGPDAHEFISELVIFSAGFTKQYAHRFRERAQNGYVVDGHGDLHSRNIFLLEEPVIFDCIEFNESYRQLDVLSDIAFFCMDLDHNHRADLGACFLKAYLSQNPCVEVAIDQYIFEFYKMYRANVRLKVTALAVIQLEKEGASSISKLKEVEEYYLLLKQYYADFKCTV